jgi:hypothetical protein
MKRQLLFTIISMLILPVINIAQNWTKEEQEVLDNVEMCWDAWMEAVEKNDMEIWFNKCPSADNLSMWWTGNGFLSNHRGNRRNFDRFVETDVKWVDLQPVAVRIHGAVAMVQFYGIWRAKTSEGQKNTEYKRTEVFQKRNGIWVFLGGQGTPSSAEDKAVYN